MQYKVTVTRVVTHTLTLEVEARNAQHAKLVAEDRVYELSDDGFDGWCEVNEDVSVYDEDVAEA